MVTSVKNGVVDQSELFGLIIYLFGLTNSGQTIVRFLLIIWTYSIHIYWREKQEPSFFLGKNQLPFHIDIYVFKAVSKVI